MHSNGSGSLNEPVVVGFGVNVYELQEGALLPPDAPTFYPKLCDWLEEDLKSQLGGLFPSRFYHPEPSHRDGEILSVRIAFEGLKYEEVGDRLSQFGSDWWEILEAEYWSAIYDQPPPEAG
jgi:hypothetical protein